MFGHVDRPRIGPVIFFICASLQARTGGFTEFVPLPFVPMETPIHLRGHSAHRTDLSRSGADACGRTARAASAHPEHSDIVGQDGAERAQAHVCSAGANDLGGTLMNESITRAAGATHGQELPPEEMEKLIRSIGREPRQRTTLYDAAPPERAAHASFDAAPFSPPVDTPARRSA